MRRFHSSIHRLLAISSMALTAAWTGGAASDESGDLHATVLPGALELVTSQALLEHTIDGLSVSSEDQVDGVRFVVAGLMVNDLNGDGLGWRLSAFPEPLRFETHLLEIGTIEGFQNFEELEGISVPSPGELLCQRMDGVAGFTTDYAISYTIPAFSPAGTYSGIVRFSVVAE